MDSDPDSEPESPIADPMSLETIRSRIALGLEQLRAGQVVEGEAAVDEVLARLRGRSQTSEGQ